MDRIFVIGNEQIRQRFLHFLSRHPLPFQCEVGPVHHQRTNEQNARLWALHTLAAKVTGYSPSEMHEFALCRHFGFNEMECGGITRRVALKRSSMRDKVEFKEFMEATENWYIEEFGVWLGQESSP